MFKQNLKLEDRLKTLRKIPDSKNNIEFRNKCYEKYKSQLPMDRYKLDSLDDEELTDALIAHQVIYYDELKERILKGANKGNLDKGDLKSLLNIDIYSGIKDKTLLRKTQGLNYVKEYVRDVIYKTQVRGKNPNPAKNLDIVRDYHRAICMVFILNPGIDKISISKLATTMQLTGSVMVVSNFRPLSSAVLFQKYGVDKTDKKEVRICVPSEGFLGRLLSSYYLALKNPDKEIHYYTIDPNQALVEPFNNMVKNLKNNGGIFNSIKNWHPIMHSHGSEIPEANFKNKYGVEMDMTFTSPPYFDTELYLNSWEIYTCNAGTKLEDQDRFRRGEKVDGCEIHRIVEKDTDNINEIKVGSEYKGKVIFYINKSTQSHSFGKTLYSWIENFFRPTVRNCRDMTKKGGYIIWNVANVKNANNLEDEIVKCCKEEGLILEDTLWYELTRRPGKYSKPNGEPVFVFRKP